MKRKISKRFELNRKEAELLRIKARQTGLSEGEYLRELISNSQPVEAPPRQFYMNMQKVNQLVADVSKLTDQIASFTEGPEPLIEEMRGIHQKLLDLMIEVKKTVSSARYYASSAYEAWMHQVEEAKKKGEIPPEMEDYEPRDRSRDIQSPEDPDLGWNALGITPPFLKDDKTKEGEDSDGRKGG